ncbi:type II toxin-antitoxin system RelE/ParE family toxin [Chitinophaga alhagiae]|uniref:type II toxin-antitoxin system RelE/ParE family toxin n=1 Tax=Chitinophaga alhagiae TaxID=2203219 RepID=UPI0013009D62|nr:type II toxin-antitoxin system RelE/ParE family toxin [Chitinophaga alhagiae]
MIKSFKSRALKLLWDNEDACRLPAQQVTKIIMMLDVLDQLKTLPDDLQPYPHWRPHLLKGNLQGYWSLTVSGNYRIIFLFEDGHVHRVGYTDYH